MSEPTTIEAALACYAQLSDGLKTTDPDRRPGAPTSQPTLLLLGRDDGALCFEEDLAGIEDRFTGSMSLVQVDDAGHSISAERPQAVLDALVPFLSELPDRR